MKNTEIKRIVIDVTSLMEAHYPSGIPRVEHNLTREINLMSDNIGYQVLTVCFRNHSYYTVPWPIDCSMGSPCYFLKIHGRLSKLNRFKFLLQLVFPSNVTNKLIKKFWHGFARFPIFIFMLPIVLPFVMASYLWVPIFGKKWHGSNNDIFLILGASWWQHNLFQMIDKLKLSDVNIATLIHDLIPLTHPEYFIHQHHRTFNQRLGAMITCSDLIVTNSEFTKSQVNHYLEKERISCQTPIEAIQLGYDILTGSDNNTLIRNRLKELLGRLVLFICVGTIEPRKNYDFVLTAYEQLWHQGVDVGLCIIGRYGWKQEHLTERLITHPKYNKRLFWFNDLNDCELEFCYTHAKGLIIASVVEGFGLPLIEALTKGCPVLASDIPVFREIGADHCRYFSLTNPIYLANHIKEILTRSNNNMHASEFIWPTWKESALQLMKILQNNFNIIKFNEQPIDPPAH